MIIPYKKGGPNNVNTVSGQITWCCYDMSIRNMKGSDGFCVFSIEDRELPIVKLNYKDAWVTISFCPFCGEKINTKRI